MSFSEEFKNLKIPAIPFTNVVPHKDVDWIEHQLQLWYTEKLISRKTAKENHSDWLCRAYSNAVCKHRLLLIGKMIILLFMIDDKSEQISANNQYEEIVIYFDTLYEDFMDFTKIDENSCSESKIFAEIWREMLPDLSSKQITLLVTSVCNFFKMSIHIQCNYRRLNKYIPLNTYMKYRRVDGCSIQSFVCAEYSLGIDFDDQIRQRKEFKELVGLCSDRMLVSNDLLGFKVDLLAGEIMNYGLSCIYDTHCTLQSAVDQTVQYLTQIDAKYGACIDFWRERNEPSVIAFIVCCMGLSHGIIDWNQQTTRYDCIVDQSIKSKLSKVENIIKAGKHIDKHVYADKTVSEVIGDQNAKLYLF